MAAATPCPNCSALLSAPAHVLLVTCSCGTRVRLGSTAGGHVGGEPADLYSVLGVTPDATADEIRAAYRRRARETHPDTGGNAAEFHAVQVAWEILGDPGRRRDHDRGHRPGGTGPVEVPDVLGVSVLVAVRRMAARGLTPVILLHPCDPDDPLHDLVIGQNPAPGAASAAGAGVQVIAAGSDAGVVWRGLRRDADRVADQFRGVAADTAAAAVSAAAGAGRRLIRAFVRLVAVTAVLALSIVIGVYDAATGLAVLAIGSGAIIWSIVRSDRRRSERRRVRHRK